MAENESESMFERKLKKYSTEQIEKAIATAITELVGDEYEVKIKSIDYESYNMASIQDHHKIQLSVQKRVNEDEGIPF